jgi:hypothetical protein
MNLTGIISKIAGLFLLQKTASMGNFIVESLLASLAAIILLAFAATLVFGFLLLGGVYIGYQTLLATGYAPLAAALVVGAAILCLLVGLLVALSVCIQKIRTLPKRLVIREAPMVNVVSHIADAFAEGFRKPQAR